MMDNIEIVHVIKKLHIYFSIAHFLVSRPSRHKAEIYDGSICAKTFYGKSRKKVRKKAVRWIHKNYDIPNDISINSGLDEG